jgi:hypothetical protein
MIITMSIWDPRVVTGSPRLAPPPRWNPSYLLALPGEFLNEQATRQRLRSFREEASLAVPPLLDAPAIFPLVSRGSRRFFHHLRERSSASQSQAADDSGQQEPKTGVSHDDMRPFERHSRQVNALPMDQEIESHPSDGWKENDAHLDDLPACHLVAARVLVVALGATTPSMRAYWPETQT